MLTNKASLQNIIVTMKQPFGELDYIFNEQCEGNQAKEIVNRVVNKIGEIFRNKATLIFGTKTTIRRKIKPDKPWYTKS